MWIKGNSPFNGNVNWYNALENSVQVPQKTKNGATIWPCNPIPGHIFRTIIWKDTSTHMFIAALFTIAKTLKQPKCPSTDEWIKKIWYVCVCVCVWYAKLLQSCLTLCDPMDCSLPGFSLHGILQARILEWVVMPSSGGSSRPRNRTWLFYVSCIGRWVLYQ